MVFLDSATAAGAAAVVSVVVVVAAAAAAAYEFPIVLYDCGAICLPPQPQNQRKLWIFLVFGVGWGGRVPPPPTKFMKTCRFSYFLEWGGGPGAPPPLTKSKKTCGFL